MRSFHHQDQVCGIQHPPVEAACNVRVGIDPVAVKHGQRPRLDPGTVDRGYPRGLDDHVPAREMLSQHELGYRAATDIAHAHHQHAPDRKRGLRSVLVLPARPHGGRRRWGAALAPCLNW